MTPDTCAVAAQVIPVMMLALVAEERWLAGNFVRRDSDSKVARMVVSLFLAVSAIGEVIAFYNIDSGVGSLGGTIVTMGAIGPIGWLAVTMIVTIWKA